MSIAASPLQVSQILLHNRGQCDRGTCIHCTKVDVIKLIKEIRSLPIKRAKPCRKRHLKRSAKSPTKPKLPRSARELLEQRKLPPHNPEHYALTPWQLRRWEELMLDSSS